MADPAAGCRGAPGERKPKGVIALVLLLALLLSLNAWLLEPLMEAISAVLELSLWPWLALAAGAWLLAGRDKP